MKKSLIHLMFISFLLTDVVHADDPTITCTVSCPTLSFSNINPYDYTSETSLGTITVRCTTTSTSTKTVTYYVGLQGGNSSNYRARYLSNGPSQYSYNIYLDSANTQILGDSTNNTFYITRTVNFTKALPSNQTYTIYGTIPVQPLTTPKTYTDNMICGVLYDN